MDVKSPDFEMLAATQKTEEKRICWTKQHLARGLS